MNCLTRDEEGGNCVRKKMRYDCGVVNIIPLLQAPQVQTGHLRLKMRQHNWLFINQTNGGN
jgi:hypothetical protein